jgi:hypothetical protein
LFDFAGSQAEARTAKAVAPNHTHKMQNRLNATIARLCQDIDEVEEPKLRAMLETSAGGDAV